MASHLELLPAVDVSDGQSVRLSKGDEASIDSYGSAIDAARTWIDLGAKWIHLVDLDAAFGKGSNQEVLESVIANCHGVKIQVSGGITNKLSLENAINMGATRVNLATNALSNLDWVAEAVETYGNRVAIGLDVSGTSLIGRGSTQSVGELFEVFSRLEQMGCQRYIVTDVSKDGMLLGSNLDLLREVLDHTDKPVVASGGISSLADIEKLIDLVPLGLEGAILGKALYAKRFTLKQALELTSK